MIAIVKYNAGNNQLVLEKYWDIDFEKQDKKITDHEAIEQFNHLFDPKLQIIQIWTLPMRHAVVSFLVSSCHFALCPRFSR